MANQTRPENESPTNWGLVVLLVVGGIICAFNMGKASPALPRMRQDFGIGLVYAGWILSSYNFISAASGIGVGAAADNFGYRRTAMLGLALLGIGGTVGSIVSNGSGILGSRFVEGIGYILVAVSIPPLLVRVSSQRHQKVALGLWGAWWPIGITVLLLLSPVLLEHYGWRGLWVFNAVVVIAYLGAFAYYTHKIDERRRDPPIIRRAKIGKKLFDDILLISRSPAPVALAATFLTYALNTNAVLGFFPILLIDEMGKSESVAVLLTALMLSLGIVGNIFGILLLRRNIARWVIIALASAIMTLTSVGIYSNELSPEIRYMVALIFYLVGGVIPSSVFAAMPVLAPNSGLIGATNGLIIQSGNIGFLIGPPILGFIVAHHGGWQLAPLLITTSAFVSMGCSILVGRYERALSK